MMYKEFIELTGFTEECITSDMYDEYIEPIYMASSDYKSEWCDHFCSLYHKYVGIVIEELLCNISTGNKLSYIDGENPKLAAALDATGNALVIALLTGIKQAGDLDKYERGMEE